MTDNWILEKIYSILSPTRYGTFGTLFLFYVASPNDRHLTLSSGIIASPGWPLNYHLYQSNEHCKWTLHLNSIKYVIIFMFEVRMDHASTFDTCLSDYDDLVGLKTNPRKYLNFAFFSIHWSWFWIFVHAPFFFFSPFCNETNASNLTRQWLRYHYLILLVLSAKRNKKWQNLLKQVSNNS